MAIAVNCLESEATWKIVFSVFSIPYSKFDSPTPPAYFKVPLTLTANEAPGLSLHFHLFNNSIIF